MSVSVPVISIIVYWVINLIKHTFNHNEKLKRWIPLLAASFGVVIGIVAYYVAPNLGLGNNVLVAAVIGGASGLSATGAHQVMKQMSAQNGEANKK